MLLSEIGGEFAFIKRISRRPKHREVVVGIGDDAAVIEFGGKLLAVTTDMLVERDHFSLDYFLPRQIGIKAMESNVSDIAAMGGKPLYAFISICLPKATTVEFIDGFYGGIYESAEENGIDVLGGDTTHGELIVVNITLIGELKKRKRLPLRSCSKEGDLIFVTGNLGASTAGLKLFQRKMDGFDSVKKRHLEPKARMDVSRKIAAIANAMEDVSDGLASEVRNICLASGKGAILFAEKIPINEETRKAAAALGEDPVDCALFGGEDFELVFTVPKKYEGRAKKLGTAVGRITSGSKVFLEKNSAKQELTKFGYDHFA